MAEAVVRHHLGPAGVETHSCGLLEAGSPATPEAIEAVAGYGIDLSGHRSRRLNAHLVEESDLVLAMTRQHLREVVVTVPEAFAWTFTFKELVRRGEAAGARRPDEDLAAYLARVGEGRRPADLSGDSPADDVADPIGLPPEAYRATVAELDDLARRAGRLLFPA